MSRRRNIARQWRRLKRGFQHLQGRKQDDAKELTHVTTWYVTEATIDAALVPLKITDKYGHPVVTIIRYAGNPRREVLHDETVGDYSEKHKTVAPFHAVDRIPDEHSIRRSIGVRYTIDEGLVKMLVAWLPLCFENTERQAHKRYDNYMDEFADTAVKCFAAQSKPVYGRAIQTAPVIEHSLKVSHHGMFNNRLAEDLDDTNYWLCTRFVLMFESLQLKNLSTGLPIRKRYQKISRINLQAMPKDIVFDPLLTAIANKSIGNAENHSYIPILMARPLVLEVRQHPIEGRLSSYDLVYLDNFSPSISDACHQNFLYDGSRPYQIEEQVPGTTGSTIPDPKDYAEPPQFLGLDYKSLEKTMTENEKIRSDHEWSHLMSPAYAKSVSNNGLSEIVAIPESLRVICTLFDREITTWRRFFVSFKSHVQWLTTLVYEGNVRNIIISRVLSDLSLISQLLRLVEVHCRLLNKFLGVTSRDNPFDETAVIDETPFATWWNSSGGERPLAVVFPLQYKFLNEVRQYFDEYAKPELEIHKQEMEAMMSLSFNIASIAEAELSRHQNEGLKRLSWITFVFLPLLFVASLFGMNVDLLSNNPQWWWYLVLCVPSALIIAIVWLANREVGKHRMRRNDYITLAEDE